MTFPFPSRRWDIFCTVIDNFGDIGICWRLARQLAGEHGQQVRLWVDDLASFHRIWPDIDPALARQSCRGVDVRLWSHPLPPLTTGDMPDIVIEAFACDIPDDFVALLAARAETCGKPPVWINMEYLSAEEWILGCHGLHSPHPRYRLQKTFWFPGFRPGTGGLLREHDLLARRDAFVASPAAQQAFWEELGLPLPVHGELRLSMFGYDQPPAELQALVALWSRSPTPVSICAAEGKLASQLQDAMHGQPGRGNLTLHILPFLEQDHYDRLLWACDINFVRGEDSFVRAQWAAKPFVWQIYRQQENIHIDKLDAFLALYKPGQSPSLSSAGEALDKFWQAWNRGANIAAGWPAFLAERTALQTHAENWSKNMQNLGDFSRNLMLYCQNAL